MRTVRRRVLAAVAAAVLLTGTLSACGGGDDYCELAQDNQSIFVDDGTGVGLLGNIATMQKLADAAPDDIKDEWQVFIAAVTELRDAITSVGLQPSDFTDGKPPSTIPEADKQTIAAAANRLAQTDVIDAGNGIEQHAKDICKLQLGL